MMGKYIPVTTFHQTERECVGKWVCGICSHSQLQRPWCIIILIIVPDKNVHIQFMWNAAAWFNVIFIPFICTLTPITIFQCDLSFVSSPTLPGRGAFAMDALHVRSRGMALHRIRSLWPAPPHPPQLNWIMLFYMGPSVCPMRGTLILLYLGVEEEERVGGVWSRRKWSFSDRDLSLMGFTKRDI